MRLSAIAILLAGSIAWGDISAPRARLGTEACRELYDFKFPTHTGADGIPDEVVSRTFDGLGRVASEESRRDDAPDRRTTFQYDGAGRLVREVRRVVGGKTVSVTTHRYDGAGREIEIGIDEDVDGRADWLTFKTYDSRGRLATLRENVKAGTQRRGLGTWYRYDASDRLLLAKVDNDGDGSPNLEIEYKYDGRGLLVEKHSHWYDGGTLDEVFTYEYDDSRRLARETDRYGFTWVHRYDAAGRLAEKVREVPPKLVDRTPMMRITYDYTCH